jgi:hypothetical protein
VDTTEYVRTPTAVAQMRALAQARRDGSPFGEAWEGGVIDALDWVCGVGDGFNTGPASEYAHAASDEDAIATEWLAARDREHENRGTSGSWRAGGVAAALAWYRGISDETPA